MKEQQRKTNKLPSTFPSVLDNFSGLV